MELFQQPKNRAIGKPWAATISVLGFLFRQEPFHEADDYLPVPGLDPHYDVLYGRYQDLSAGAVRLEHVVAAGRYPVPDRAYIEAVLGEDLHADEVEIIVLILPGLWQVFLFDGDLEADKRLGGAPVSAPLEHEDVVPLVLTGALDSALIGLPLAGKKYRAPLEAVKGPVGGGLDLSFKPVYARYPGNGDKSFFFTQLSPEQSASSAWSTPRSIWCVSRAQSCPGFR